LIHEIVTNWMHSIT